MTSDSPQPVLDPGRDGPSRQLDSNRVVEPKMAGCFPPTGPQPSSRELEGRLQQQQQMTQQ